MNLSIIILAAGQGTRMRSRLPKVLHKLAGRSLLEHVHVSASRMDHRGIYIVYGYGGGVVPKALPHLGVNWVQQEQQLGTGHAVKIALPDIPDEDVVLVLYGDIPLITSETLTRLVDAAGESGFSLLTSYIDDPSGYGRIIRDEVGNVVKIVEHRDATGREMDVCEINTGMMAVNARMMRKWLDELDTNNAQGEFYLTDIIAKAVSAGLTISAISPQTATEVRGINDRAQLAELERYYQLVQAHHLMTEGVTLMDPARFDLRGALESGEDVLIDINVIIEGSVSLGNNVSIGANCYINNADIGNDTVILPNTVIDNAVIGPNCRIGPFARIRPDTRLADSVHVGNFVELKNTDIQAGSKVNHLSYVGDSTVGRNVNIGAGTITCNYDGAEKHRTIIEDDVFIGSDTQLIAPVVIGKGATIGAGTTVTRDVKPDTLNYTRIEHRESIGWQRPSKKKT